MERLAIFDVDFTITSKETLIEFYRFIVGRYPGKIARLPQAAASGLFYKLGIHDEKDCEGNVPKVPHKLFRG